MTREEALKLADEELERLIKSGDEAIFAACQKEDGSIDTFKMAQAAMRARERIADRILNKQNRG